jgi:hypothetical protein
MAKAVKPQMLALPTLQLAGHAALTRRLPLTILCSRYAHGLTDLTNPRVS